MWELLSQHSSRLQATYNYFCEEPLCGKPNHTACSTVRNHIMCNTAKQYQWAYSYRMLNLSPYFKNCFSLICVDSRIIIETNDSRLSLMHALYQNKLLWGYFFLLRMWLVYLWKKWKKKDKIKFVYTLHNIVVSKTTQACTAAYISWVFHTSKFRLAVSNKTSYCNINVGK